jgi:uncharacterized protein YjbI with pentapeptide repeats
MDHVSGDQWFDASRAAVTTLGVLGLGGAAYLAFRKQQSTEVERHDAIQRDLHSRFTDAASQLGHDDATIRLAGVYALASLADDWYSAGDSGDQRRVVVNLFAAYLRSPDRSVDDAERAREAEVRSSITNLIASRTSVAASSSKSWAGYALDLRGVNLEGPKFADAKLSDAILTAANLAGADLTKAQMNRAILSGAILKGADLAGADLFAAELDRADLTDANLIGTRFLQANLGDAILTGAVWDETTTWPEGFGKRP